MLNVYAHEAPLLEQTSAISAAAATPPAAMAGAARSLVRSCAVCGDQPAKLHYVG